MRIIIHKSQRTLMVQNPSGETRFTCKISLGSCPEGPKTREGDGKTPEGLYRICAVNENSKYTFALALSYPNATDAKQAFRRGEIPFWQLPVFTVCEKLGIRPPWNTPLGGLIMIHGEHPEGKCGDWTAGCIALSNADIYSLSLLVKKGDAVEIQP